MPKGKKICPQCNEPNGVRAAKCKSCGYEFRKKTRPAPAKSEMKEPNPEQAKGRNESRGMTGDMFVPNILTPNGSCPIKPHGYASGVFADGYTDDTIRDWTARLRAHGKSIRVNYTPSAIKYWARTYWDIHSDEFDNVKQQIDAAFTPAAEPEDAADATAA